LDSNPDADKDTYKDRYKTAEEAVRPYMMKMYGSKGSEESEMPIPGPGPKIEEVD
jgi:hypothetical protein